MSGTHRPYLKRLGVWVLAIVAAVLPRMVRGDDFCLLSGNRSAYEARLELIDLAEQEIVLAYYAIDTGAIALTLLDHLRNAARRGVQVHILVDGLMSRLPSDFEDQLIKDGVAIRVYHPPFKGRPGWLNRRLHHKLFIVDRQAMIVGSRNLEDAHFGFDQDNFEDMDALITGDVCRQAAEHFDQLWCSDAVFPVDQSVSFGLDLRDNWEMKVPVAVVSSLLRSAASAPASAFDLGDGTPAQHQRSSGILGKSLVARRIEVYEQRLRDVQAQLDNSQTLVDSPYANCVDLCIENVHCSLMHDQASDKSARHFQRQIIELIDSADTSLWIESPYPVLERPVKDALRRARDRGVVVLLFTNSLASTDRTAPYAAYQNDKREFLRQGIQLVEYVGRDTLHSKSILVDDACVLLGSYNMDARSDRLNLEFGVLVHDVRVTALVKRLLLHRMQASEVVEKNFLALPAVMGDAPAAKLARMRFRQLLVPLIRGSL